MSLSSNTTSTPRWTRPPSHRSKIPVGEDPEGTGRGHVLDGTGKGHDHEPTRTRRGHDGDASRNPRGRVLVRSRTPRGSFHSHTDTQSEPTQKRAPARFPLGLVGPLAIVRSQPTGSGKGDKTQASCLGHPIPHDRLTVSRYVKTLLWEA